MHFSAIRRLAVSVVSATILLTTAHTVLAARPEVGAVTRAQNEVMAEYRTSARPLQVDSAVLFKDFVVTGEEARLEALLKDDTKITLGENAELLIDEFVYDPAAEKGSLTMMVLEGAFLFVGGKIEEMVKPVVTIVTPAAVLGVRGTTVWGGEIDGGFGILCLDGEVEVLTDGGAVTLQANQGTMVFGRDKPTDPGTWADEKIGRAVATISFRE